MEVPFALAFTAGLVATINPCGFAMLPAYLSYFIGVDDEAPTSTVAGLRRGLLVSGVVSLGFLAVFGLAGALISFGVRSVIDALPWAAMVVGIGVAGLGVATLSGFELRTSLPQVRRGHDGRGLRGAFWFGVSYAVASLSCTLPVFLVVVAGAIPQLGLLPAIATFLVYGLGMSTLLLVVTLAVALGKRSLVVWLRRSSRHVSRVAGAILVVAGGYIVVFWASQLAGGTSQSSAATRVEQLSSTVTNWVTANAAGVGIAAAVALVAAVAAVWTHGRRTARRPVAEPASPEGPASTETRPRQPA